MQAIDSGSAAFRTALQYLARGDYAAAEALLQPLRAQPRAGYLLGLAALGRDDLATARPLLAEAAAALPEDAAVQANWSLCLFRCEEYAQALAASDRTLRLAPAHADGHYNRGLVLLRLNRPNDAALAFTRAARPTGGGPNLSATPYSIAKPVPAGVGAGNRAAPAAPGPTNKNPPASAKISASTSEMGTPISMTRVLNIACQKIGSVAPTT